jgi:signal transduction histidine kinase
VWVAVRRQAGQVLVEVGDTGVGMSDEFVQTRLFRPFSSTKDNGMGIGTHESLAYVRELGGQIDVATRAGQGTVMTVQLPLFHAHADREPQPSSASTQGLA